MKKKIVATAMTLLTAFVMVIGVSIPAFAYSKEATIVSATNSSGESVEATFTLEDLDIDMTSKFWEISEAEQESVMVYYGFDYLATSPYAVGTLDLSNSGASVENPVTLTFSLVDEYGDIYPAGCKWLYVLQKFEDGTYKLINAQSPADNTVTAQFTDAVSSKILIVELDLARESIDFYDIGEATPDIDGVLNATDAQGNSVNVTAAPLDSDFKAIAADKAFMEFNGITPIAATDVNLEGTNVSADNPITVTFSVAGVKAGDTITVLHKKTDGTWENLPGTVGNGTVTATFTSFSPVVFVRTAAAATDSAPKKDKVPNTGETDMTVLWLSLAALSGAGMVCLYRRKKTVMK